MGFFGKKKKTTTPAEPKATPAAPVAPVEDKKEPLLPESANDEPTQEELEAIKPDPLDPEEGDADLTVSSSYYRNQVSNEVAKVPSEIVGAKTEDSEIETKIPDKGIKVWCASMGAALAGIPAAAKYAIAGGAIAALLLWGIMRGNDYSKDYNVAFIGNSYIFVNDIPRMMEAISEGHVYQDSCLHGKGSMLNLLKTGNGMYEKWNTDAALIEGKEDIYDFGACSVPQLLTGQDKMVSKENYLGTFYDDGYNPCFHDENYYSYRISQDASTWDYVVLTDQSKRMCFEEARAESLMAFNYTYGPILNDIGSKPIIVQPHAFWSEQTNMTGLEGIPYFTGLIKEGAKEYRNYLDGKLSFSQRSKIAPVGDVFLAIWEDSDDMWVKLFLNDGIHPSGYGSYIYGLVIYAVVYGFMPKMDVVVNDDIESTLFGDARKIQAENDEQPFPTQEEAEYLYKMVKKVVLGLYLPNYNKYSEDETYSDAEADDDYEGDDDYTVADDDEQN